MENQPTLAYVCQKRTRAGPKMGMDPGLACLAAQDCTRSEPGVKHRPKVTQNGHGWFLPAGTGKPVTCSLCLVQEQATRQQAVAE
jgi:hypothetical protein